MPSANTIDLVPTAYRSSSTEARLVRARNYGLQLFSYLFPNMICVILSLASVLSQPPHPPPFTYYYADVSSTLTYPSGAKQHSKGIAAYDSKVANRSAW